jgi:tetratricopeptide (TPR) repeat protein
VASSLLGGARSARGDEGLSTGRSHLVVVSPSPSEGLEVGIPRDTWYAKGIALDLQGKWDESYAAYREALTEFHRLLRERPTWAKMIRGWILKAEYQIDLSQRLKYPLYYTFGPPSASALYYRGEAKHKKWLAIRAFTGRTDRRLQDQIMEDYSRALQQLPSYDSARIALAAMCHETGQHAKARQEIAKVQQSGRTWLSVDLAYYYAAAGDTERALDLVERAVGYSSSQKRNILRANDFDRLRAHPRFRRLVGEPPEVQ